jgi:hypothetical protein
MILFLSIHHSEECQIQVADLFCNNNYSGLFVNIYNWFLESVVYIEKLTGT